MKNLPEPTPFKSEFNAVVTFDGVASSPQNPVGIILLLHGLNERGKRIFRKLLPHLPTDQKILAPNGPYPVKAELETGYAWYLFDRGSQEVVTPMAIPAQWLKAFIEKENPQKLPVTIIGFSQGGYLAPLVGLGIKETKVVIGLACEFRSVRIPTNCDFPLIAVHGAKDEIVLAEASLTNLTALKERGMETHWHPLPDTAHEITHEMGVRVKTLLETYGN